MGRIQKMSKTYLVTLKPIDKFFFGGDMTFAIPEGNKERKEANRSFSSYIIRSMPFPQQTSLLGMLRFLLLRNDKDCFNGDVITDKSKAKGLIGSHSFMVSGSRNNYGGIEELTSCFIRDCRNGRDFAFAPFDWDFDDLKTGDVGYINGQKVLLPRLSVPEQVKSDYGEDEYKAKKGYNGYLLYRNGDRIEKIKVSDVFEEDRRIGIMKNPDGKTEDSALFKQISYRFRNFTDEDGRRTNTADYCFAFYVKVKDDCKLAEYDGQVVLVGADSSQFVINIIDEPNDNRPLQIVRDYRVVLQSPSFISHEMIETSYFFITQTIPFRFMTTTVDNTKDYTLRAGFNRSRKYELYAPGSVFYFENSEKAETFKENLEKREDFRQIGYNYYLNPKK